MKPARSPSAEVEGSGISGIEPGDKAILPSIAHGVTSSPAAVNSRVTFCPTKALAAAHPQSPGRVEEFGCVRQFWVAVGEVARAPISWQYDKLHDGKLGVLSYGDGHVESHQWNKPVVLPITPERISAPHRIGSNTDPQDMLYIRSRAHHLLAP